MATVAMPPFHGTGWLILPALTLLFAALREAPCEPPQKGRVAPPHQV
jgi:hypothetical protein